MATAAAGNDAAVKGGGKKKLIIIIAIVLVVVLAGVAALLLMKKKSHGDDEEGAAEEKPAAAAHAKPGTPPTFVPLDPFTVNLADKEVDRFAQIGITLEVADPHFADQLKAYMPAIRNNVLIVLSHKTSAELLTVEGKEKLAREIRRESVRPMGIELDDEEDEDADAPKKKKKKKRPVESPVTQVLFSTFIVQ
ncbi:flagellar basal body-associated FliL family protein [Roseateles chitosanitabidus]|jgi:flagellar FliL protein|uniref:flagellar basal body-associated FliL family protein n=1 Tax=Roseateles chitosanitabidus TaxID=65048 RepID=UPI0008319487|nr:flagellar basal body-associated FliL family protein [Roseateles chitosanitabidus]MBO9689488.1 flagellar basal body-associated FliL family protein [Roseateles chitosanitabidus]